MLVGTDRLQRASRAHTVPDPPPDSRVLVLPLAALAGFPVTDKPASGESKRAPRDKQANRRTQGKRSIKQFKGKS